MEVRPRVASGLLLQVPSEHGHFSVFMRGGEVGLALVACRVLRRVPVDDELIDTSDWR